MTKSELITVVQSLTGWTTKDTVIGNGLDFGLQELARQVGVNELRHEIDVVLSENSLVVDLPSTTVDVLEARLLTASIETIDDCNDSSLWTGVTNVTPSDDKSVFRNFNGSLKLAITSSFSSTGLLASMDDLGSTVDASDADFIGFWLRSDKELQAGDVSVVLTEDSVGAKTTVFAEASCSFVPAGVWTPVRVYVDLSSVDALLSVGVYLNRTGLTALNLWFDNIVVGTEDSTVQTLRLLTESDFMLQHPLPSQQGSGQPAEAFFDRSARVLRLCAPANDDYLIRLGIRTSKISFTGTTAENPFNGSDEFLSCYAARWLMLSLEKFVEAEKWRVEAFTSLSRWLSDHRRRDGVKLVHKGFGGQPSSIPPQWWLDPFVKENP